MLDMLPFARACAKQLTVNTDGPRAAGEAEEVNICTEETTPSTPLLLLFRLFFLFFLKRRRDVGCPGRRRAGD